MPPKPRMLIVDDEPLILYGLSQVLEEDYDVVAVTSGAGGLKVLAETPDMAVIVSDQRMPEMEGCEFLRQAKTLSTALRLLMTGYSHDTQLRQAVQDGTIQGCLTKPFRLQDLLRTIAEAGGPPPPRP